MELAALLCRNSGTADAVLFSLRAFTVCPVKDIPELEESCINYTYDAVIIDSNSVESSQINSVIKLFGDESVIVIAGSSFDMLNWKACRTLLKPMQPIQSCRVLCR